MTTDDFNDVVDKYRKTEAYKKDLQKILNGDCDVKGFVEIAVNGRAAKFDNIAVHDVLNVLNSKPLHPDNQEVKTALEEILRANFFSWMCDLPADETSRIRGGGAEDYVFTPDDNHGHCHFPWRRSRRSLWPSPSIKIKRRLNLLKKI